ncbi:hypothetical protein HHK36_032643 [Tetracentron sinense]|uniref:Dihydrolipoamide acetyltransferase component of pyruvate dehydrogenase complex n=1 Tax=Tetracentron sinense TaxID=13715 RepID=A0A835CXE4_TETSI|nr:hypothetical protein HHK36_032643 [Tetracentron sinense]
MIWRRVWQEKAWNSGRQVLCAYSRKRAPSVPLKQKIPFLGFSSRPILFRYACASTSFAKNTDLNNSYTIRRCCFSSHAWVDLPVGGIVEVPLAQTGEGIAECELLKWFVQEGDQVEEFQPLCEVQSDKATMEITSRYQGKISQILYGPGDIVKVSSLYLSIMLYAFFEMRTCVQVGETLLKMVVEELQASRPCTMDNTAALGSEICDSSSQSLSVNKDNVGEVLCTPAVRNFAKQYGININNVHGTGLDGRILKDDVLKYVSNQGTFREPCASSRARIGEEKYSHALATDGCHYEDKTIPLRGFQRLMVKSMTMAAKVPHFHYLEEINCDALVDLKASFQNENSDPDVKHTYLPFLIKSLSMALSKYPFLNSSFSEESHEVILKGCHNIGIAMATPSGLVVPNIKKVQSLSILEITKELSRLQQLALNNKLSPEDISDGTMTLSNIGAIGGKFGSPLLNLPEVAIIAIGRIQKLPRFADDGSVYPASIINVNIGADHRVVDGATVARFCNEWKLLVEKPELLMLHMR